MPEVILVLVALIATVLYAREAWLRKKQARKQSEVTKDDLTYYQTISGLTQRSSEIVNQAEKDAEKLISDTKLFSEKATQDLGSKMSDFLQFEEKQTQQVEAAITDRLKSEEDQFNSFVRHLTSVLDNKTEASIKDFNLFLEHLKQESQKSQAANWKGAQERVGELFENFEQKMADFLLQSEQKMMLSVDLELKSARQLIDTYKVQQMDIIDENIVAMLEKTLSLVLAKNLNLKDQMELVYESLERAKTESFLV